MLTPTYQNTGKFYLQNIVSYFPSTRLHYTYVHSFTNYMLLFEKCMSRLFLKLCAFGIIRVYGLSLHFVAKRSVDSDNYL